MEQSSQVKEDINLEWSHLAHHLRRMEKLFFCDRGRARIRRCLQVDFLDELHLIKQGVEGDEEREGDGRGGRASLF